MALNEKKSLNWKFHLDGNINLTGNVTALHCGPVETSPSRGLVCATDRGSAAVYFLEIHVSQLNHKSRNVTNMKMSQKLKF